jgi:hypothetical protein
MRMVSLPSPIPSRHVAAHLPTVVAGVTLLALTFSSPEHGVALASEFVLPNEGSMWASSPVFGRSGWILVAMLVVLSLVVSVGMLLLDWFRPRVTPRMLPVAISSGVVALILVVLYFYLARQSFFYSPPVILPGSVLPGFGRFTAATTTAFWIACASFCCATLLVVRGHLVRRRFRVGEVGKLDLVY